MNLSKRIKPHMISKPYLLPTVNPTESPITNATITIVTAPIVIPIKRRLRLVDNKLHQFSHFSLAPATVEFLGLESVVFRFVGFAVAPPAALGTGLRFGMPRCRFWLSGFCADVDFSSSSAFSSVFTDMMMRCVQI